MELLERFHIVHSWIGLFHTIFSILAMVFGTMVFFNKKGTRKHKKLGYLYLISMLILNLSAFGIYNFGSFSLFHGFALLSLLSIFLGIIPAWQRKNEKWLVKHFYFMNWSVVGLYCAFWAEVGVRFFEMKYFWWVVMLATMTTAMIGSKIIKKEALKMNLH